MKKLSICIPVYNQVDLVKKNLLSICKYPGKDIEIVVSDDCSTEDIKTMIEQLKDNRIKYYKTKKNLGHDLNILNGLKHCTSKYAFLLRSRDTILGKKIVKILELIERYPDAAYFAFSAENEDQEIVLKFENRVWKKGKEAAQAHSKLFVHPSGNLYNLQYLNIEILESYMRKYFDNIFGFVVHDLIRMQLAERGDFITSKEVVWIYSDTQEAKDIAVNSSPKKISVYAPEYDYPRYKCEFAFVRNEIDEEIKVYLLKLIVKLFYRRIGYTFKLDNDNKKGQKHYNYKRIDYSPQKERKKFIEYSIKLWKEYPTNYQTDLKKVIKLETIKMTTIYPIKYQVINLLGNKSWFKRLVYKIQNI